ncbi:hypothetical protein I4552_25815 [Klebsiella michiganensis]|uniref:hypothetical protein n=1 Tax=Klebsiella michiganensis TaxID=1134687 RepID=UPI0015B15BB3|nr:hypothetical protein [Klebsiella michiganensis]MBG2621425.1 hypothetical protein [Klebsiella michiganensis]MBG2634399.1 hypothetical protein [Klebsiella michiganensis]HCK0916611.1 hypothetical protein [Klebsiella michiganensis]
MLASAPFPARGVNALAGLPDRRRRGARSPGQRSAIEEAGRRIFQAGPVPGSRRKRLSRATGSTGSQTWVNP